MAGTVLAPQEKSIPRIVQAINQLLQGRVNSTGVVTLRTGATTTVVAAPNCGPASQVFLTPKTAHAAALTPPPYVLAANVTLGQFVITHPVSGFTDLNLGWDARG